MIVVKDFKDLLVWQKGMLIAEQCYLLTKNFPKEEIYGMVSQIRRASVSIPANISEGYGRHSKGDYVRFLNIAKGSVNELETHLLLANRLNLCNSKDVSPIIDLLQEETKMIISLIKKLSS
jgi:four helix bundle protein